MRTIAAALAALALATSAIAQDRPRTTQPDPAKPRQEDRRDQRTADLRPKFKPGQQTRLRMELDSKNKLTIPALDDRPREQTSRQEIGILIKVNEVADAGSTVSVSFESVKMTLKSQDETQEFDSAHPASRDADNPLAPGLRALVGTSFELRFDPDGNIVSMTGGGNLTSLSTLGLGDGLGGGLGSPAGGAAGLSGQAFQDAISSIFNLKKSGGAASVGETWTVADDIDSGLLGRFRISTDHTLKSIAGNDAKVAVAGRIERNTHDPSAASLFQIKDSFYKGDYVWDTAGGMIRSMDLDQRVVIETNAAGAAVTLDSTTRTKVTRVR